jgi:hypothetical protein
MEEQILKIINRSLLTNIKLNDGLRGSAKEITAMMMEFIEWIAFGTHQMLPNYEEKDFYNNEDNTLYTIDELFQYWIENVKK